MKKIFQSILLTMIAAGSSMSVISCGDADEMSQVDGANKVPLEITTAVSTRSIIDGTTLPEESQFGIFAMVGENGYTAVENGVNTLVTYVKSTCTLNKKVYLPESTNVHVYAYYPYNSNYNETYFLHGKMPIEVESQTDYLYGYSVNSDNKSSYVNSQNPKATILFKHAMSLVSFVIKKDEKYSEDIDIYNVGLSNVYTQGVLNIIKENEEQDVVIGNTLGYISTGLKEHISTDGLTVNLLAIPMNNLYDREVQVSLNYGYGGNDKKPSISLPTEITNQWLPGQKYTYTVTIKKGSLSISEAVITPWNNHEQGGIEVGNENYTGASIGDIYYSDGTYSSQLYSNKTPIGIVFALTDEKDGEINRTLSNSNHGRIIALLDVNHESLQWTSEYLNIPTLPAYVVENSGNTKISPEGNIIQWDVPETDAWADFNGQQNTRLIIDATEKCPAAYQCHYSYKTPGRETGTWYLPSAGELKLLELLFNEKLIYSGVQECFTDMSDAYWSSTQADREFAVVWSNGKTWSEDKVRTWKVRAATTF